MFGKCDAVVWDLEILNAIEQVGVPRVPGVNYVEPLPGMSPWDCKEQMGISVLTAFDCLRQRMLTYFAEDIPDFLELLAKRKLSVTFNGVRFDSAVIEACGHKMPEVTHYDVLLEGWEAAGGRKAGFKLENFLQANFGYGKILDGATAPVLWQQGKRGRVVSYCADDTSGTTELFYRILSDGFLKHPSGDGRLLRFRMPFEKANDTPKVFQNVSNVNYSKRGLVPEIQPGLLPGIPDKVIGYHREVKPEGAPKSSDANREVKENPRVD